MSFVAAAVAGGTIVSGLMASNQAEKSRKAASRASAEQLEFERQKYEEWKAVYGDLQENLGEYYSSLTPEFYETQGLEAFELEQQEAMERIREELAQRGISDSGLAISLEQRAELEAAEERAAIRVEAPLQVAQEQRNFLQVGLGLNPSQGVSTALRDKANQASNQAMMDEQAAGEAIGTAIQSTGMAIADYMNKPSTAPAVQPSTNYVSTTPQQVVDYSAYA